MTSRRIAAFLSCVFAILFIAGCAVTTRARGQNDQIISVWHGRLAVRVAADPAAQPQPAPEQSFSAAFDLQGNAQQGSLIFFTPFGSTAAAIRWTPDLATLQANGESREFNGLSQLIEHLLGTEVPVPALFAWLEGQALASDGWQVDLSQRTHGKIVAHRQTPAPTAELRVMLED